MAGGPSPSKARGDRGPDPDPHPTALGSDPHPTALGSGSHPTALGSGSDPGPTPHTPQKEGQIREGLVSVGAPPGETVFYNPAQVFNRDLSILVLKAFACRQQQLIRHKTAAAAARCKAEGKPEPPPLEFVGFNVVEALAATGLRSLRYVKELEGVVRCAVANDLDPAAAAAAAANAKLNNVPPNSFFAAATAAAAAAAAGGGEGGLPFFYDVVDIDPYGSSAGFLAAAISLLRSGGLLCVTCTDTATLVGNSVETAFYKYGGSTAKMSSHHEVAIR
ncbi:hypothetical protein EBH_0077530 [Eimeria brunetti]|uniref:tRNA (guanine(26)-N(2))-dimethyltransferase n=1 Tax=Eimeria brunetti TaxID=51314 RepID=U6LCM0_9EIME|nr:hypothetical protein EBH_0077530 [Eimeria brunetti]